MKINERIILEDIILKTKKRKDVFDLDFLDKNYIVKYFTDNLNKNHLKKIVEKDSSFASIVGNDLIRYLIPKFNEDKLLSIEEINYLILDKNLNAKKNKRQNQKNNKDFNEIKILSHIIENELNQKNICWLINNCNDVYDIESLILVNDLYKKLDDKKLFSFNNSKKKPLKFLYDTLNILPTNKKNKVILEYLKSNKINETTKNQQNFCIKKKVNQKKQTKKSGLSSKDNKKINFKKRKIQKEDKPKVDYNNIDENYTNPIDNFRNINQETPNYSFDDESEFSQIIKLIPTKIKRGIVAGIIVTSFLIYSINGCFDKNKNIDANQSYTKTVEISDVVSKSYNHSQPKKNSIKSSKKIEEKKNPYSELIQSYKNELNSYENSLRSNNPYKMIESHKDNKKIIEKLRNENFPEKNNIINQAIDYEKRFQKLISRYANAKREQYADEFLKINKIATTGDNNQLKRALDMQKDLEQKIQYEKNKGLFSNIYLR
ncbi:MAG: hypothetical protein ACLFPJ_02145 [Candidatus Woesearchaeota archaeon]